MIASRPIWDKQTKLVPNIPTQETTLSSRIFVRPSFAFSCLHASSNAPSDEVPFLSESTLSKKHITSRAWPFTLIFWHNMTSLAAYVFATLNVVWHWRYILSGWNTFRTFLFLLFRTFFQRTFLFLLRSVFALVLTSFGCTVHFGPMSLGIWLIIFGLVTDKTYSLINSPNVTAKAENKSPAYH